MKKGPEGVVSNSGGTIVGFIENGTWSPFILSLPRLLIRLSASFSFKFPIFFAPRSRNDSSRAFKSDEVEVDASTSPFSLSWRSAELDDDTTSHSLSLSRLNFCSRTLFVSAGNVYEVDFCSSNILYCSLVTVFIMRVTVSKLLSLQMTNFSMKLFSMIVLPINGQLFASTEKFKTN